MEAYCLKCRMKREIQEATPVFIGNGSPATRGTCCECGSQLIRIGLTAAHVGLDPSSHTVISKAREKLGPLPQLVIVESPAKARTVGRFLGKGYTVRASVGHVRDLPSNRMGVDVQDDFRPRYVIPAKRKEVVRELREEAKDSSEVFLATDPDREGEAISWHLAEALKAAIGQRPVHRVEFHEITQDAISHAFANPRQIDMQRVEAQQARRILDRIVGYTLSPLLRSKMGRRGLSAGRVQSVAVRLVVERERQVAAFMAVEYWSIEVELAKRESERPEARSFFARLHRIRGEEADLHSQAVTQAVVDELQASSYQVAGVQEGLRRRNPSPPFITSTMQQEASRALGFTASRTMRCAQQLYEGIDLGEGPVGLITYMRTDSTNIAEQAQAEAREYIASQYGVEYLPPKAPQYKTRAKGAQEAHEAIRPTSPSRTPSSLKARLERDQYRLYELVWRRFIASQMTPAAHDTIAVEIAVRPSAGAGGTGAEEYVFRASGSSLRFPGFLAVYEETKEEDGAGDEERPLRDIPPLTADEVLDLQRLLPEQHFTQPPPRYTEATLVRALEEFGIGRPSTYAPILSTIQQRGYVERRNGRLYPTEVGEVVTDLLVEHFPDYVNVGFTAQMEEELDLVSSGQRGWVPLLRDFYGPFVATVTQAQDRMPTIEMGNVPTGELCPQCGQPLVLKYGRFGKFIGCNGFPHCRFRAAILVRTGAKCPECGGDLVEKRTRRGRTFFGCTNYRADDPESCRFAVWKRPLAQPCPSCGKLLVEGRQGTARCTACEGQFELAGLAEPQAQPEAT